ncbi:Nif3-like dinuclear metal center hexameric protein [Mycoplasmopsis edwardii]|uniref:Nif3-like dinuclear metal center hexameric protein n=1 Tax=Mycoplasmopsis edwardii TaxID=53558 RepID=A0ACD4PI64_9BACT|nr:Nif3-like dinuclear metal center hexameric protein [Mycoplasmopsis edwardii]WBP84374.1 Nif3-like dinuclear metal center hexameric protein [Mycoplasmopsis edwardii]
MTIKEFINKLQTLYPEQNAEPWDKTGYSVKSKQHKKFTGAVLAIDLTTEVLEFAINNNCNVILTHHPFIFQDTLKGEFEQSPYKLPIYKKLKESQITAYSMHTNYDSDLFGTSYQIFNFLDLPKEWFDKTSPTYSAVFNNSLKLGELIEKFNQIFSFKDKMRSNFEKDNNKVFSKVAMLSGSGSMDQIIKMHNELNIDLFITSDIKWNEWITYHELKINIIEIPHIIEQVYAWGFYQELNKIYPNEKFYIKNFDTPFKNIK